MQFLSSATGFPIIEFYEVGSIGFYGRLNGPFDTIKPIGENAEKEKKDPLQIVWISDPSLSKVCKNKINRVLPLISIKVNLTVIMFSLPCNNISQWPLCRKLGCCVYFGVKVFFIHFLEETYNYAV